MVQGPGRRPVRHRPSTKAVYRIDLKNKEGHARGEAGTKNKGGTVANAALPGRRRPDLLILDSKNVLWRWRPSDEPARAR
jgi:hypothetical protein